MTKKEYWNKIGDYSMIVMTIALISKMFFRKYLESVILYILIIGAIAFVVGLIAEIQKFIIKRNE